ncbi:DUF1294 domain-containing protein [Calycomorphotria hydatis]|uniref:DUF1294 domain-containing protein n=1 Tax=Calycomorphotria hydatis TaxID=2528027 RepID=UPI0018D1FE1E|nr:DUF1294 domain-containing protein [Calycomorphotria hydatis]
MKIFRPLGISGWIGIVIAIYLLVAVILLGWSSFTDQISLRWWTVCYLSLTVIASCCAFAMQGWDKWCAQKEARRIPENTLHLVEFLCGWPGSYLGQEIFRHKTSKLSYRMVFFIIVGAHLVLINVYLVNWFTS